MPNPRDPDSLLAAFAELTAAAPRPKPRTVSTLSPAIARLSATATAVVILAVVGVLLSTTYHGSPAGSVVPSVSFPPAGFGAISLDLKVESPPPGRPRPIGGWAMFGTLTSPSGENVLATVASGKPVQGGQLRSVDLTGIETGDYEFAVSVRWASDDISLDQNGNVQRDFGPVSATCLATVRVLPDLVTHLLVTAVGGDTCMIGASPIAAITHATSSPSVQLHSELGDWRLDSASLPDKATTTLHIEIHEIACSGAADPRARTLEPEIEYRASYIVITLRILEIGGDCPGNPFFPMTIELSEPIGYRALVDGYDAGIRWRGISPLETDGLDNCEGLVVPPFRTGGADTMGTELDTEHQVLVIIIFGEGDSHTTLTVRYTDQACIDHPVLGPIIEQVLADL